MDDGGRRIGDAYVRLARAQKGHARGAPAYSVYVNRRVGRAFAAIAFVGRLTPNGVTAISALHTFAGLALLIVLPATWWTGVLVAVLLALGYAWDSADGQLARLTGGGTPAGEWLDHFVDAVKISSLHLAVAVALWLHTPLRGTAWIVLPLAFSVVATVTFFGMLLNDLIKTANGATTTHERGGGTAARSVLLLPTDFGMVCVVFLLWGWTTIFWPAYVLLFAAAVGFLVLASRKWYREIRSL